MNYTKFIILSLLCIFGAGCSQDSKNKISVGVDLYHGKGWKGLIEGVEQLGLKPHLIDRPMESKDMDLIGTLIISGIPIHEPHPLKEEEVAQIEKFVARGGNLIVCDQAWAWVCKVYGNKPIEKYPLNLIGKRLGFWITDKNVGAPTNIAQTEITKGIKEIFRKDYAPSKIELQAPDSVVLLRDAELQVVAGYFKYGSGQVVIYGHGAILPENPMLFTNTLKFVTKKSKK
jgi:hypothetical protein